jgi:hypothetical protein
MTREAQAKKQKTFRETAIEDAIIAHPDKLGFPGALAIRNLRVAHTSGAVDVVLLPQTGSSFELVLVEAKAASAQDAGSKVVGQLLMYYAGALELGSDGICALRKFALASPSVAHSIPRIAPQKVMGGLRSNAECFKALTMGSRLTPQDIALFIALDDEPRHVLVPTLKILRELHSLHIGLVLVRGGSIDLILPAAG